MMLLLTGDSENILGRVGDGDYCNTISPNFDGESGFHDILLPVMMTVRNQNLPDYRDNGFWFLLILMIEKTKIYVLNTKLLHDN